MHHGICCKPHLRRGACVLALLCSSAFVASTAPSPPTSAIPPAWGPPALSAAGDRLLHQAIAAIRRQENAVRSLRLYASSRFYGETYDSGRKKWIWHKRPLNVYRLTAVFDGLPLGKFRADVSRDWELWPAGPQPVTASRWSVAFNGRVGTYLRTYAGGPKHEVPFNHGNVSGGMPSLRRVVDLACGWTESIYGITSNLPNGYGNQRLSAYLRPNQKWAWIRANWAKQRGKKYLEVTRVGDPRGKEVFLLDPRKGFSVVRYDSYGWLPRTGTGGRIYLVPGKVARGYADVSGFFEPLPGLFYPRKIAIKAFDRSVGRFRKKAVIFVSRVVANDPAVRGATYVVHFPRGAIVTDLVSNKVIRIGGTPRQQMRAIEAAVRQVRRDTSGPANAKP